MSTSLLEPSQVKIDLGQLKRKKVNIALFGKGNVGLQFINQLLGRKDEIAKRRNLDLNVFCIANSEKIVLQKQWTENWEAVFNEAPNHYRYDAITDFVKQEGLTHLVLVDNTASRALVAAYPWFIENGFHLVSSNKLANTQSLEWYQNLRRQLGFFEKEYLYETNVGAGLPLIDTIKLLHLSGENITRIRGVFSGTLSYLFNEFSAKNLPFSSILQEAMNQGFTEPDPREDLSGSDVARKLLILARELDLYNEMEDVSVQNLVPKELRNVSKEVFFQRLKALDVPFQIQKKNIGTNEVLRYVADLSGHLMDEHGAQLSVRLLPVSKDSVLGQLKGSDSLFEIYTDSYGAHPIVIQGAGAGAKVTARGVFGDLLRLSEKI
ncbi:MAG TPA: aspartate kinase [Flavobacteriaceae bacterium]|nr:aspartate kinase [Flavobacteriaceae bacterium]MCB9213040.1 aspartate kinase [Alteromonas sp.]HPF10945.1 aspartate kinase [Flavobacteriaceae bacterium]HQU20313.1 aspartate kinase [Flavobacteriaceae bacterium]HQU64205.1 aspartate kinase [Flavobacteriaceae bacterium]